MNDMDQLHELPDELFGLVGKKKFHELDTRQQEMVLQWFSEDEFNRASLLIQETEAVFRADEALLTPDPALAALLSARMRSKHRKPLLMRLIPIWQAAAMLLLAMGLGYLIIHTPPQQTLALQDTVYITRDVSVAHTIRDTVYVQQQTHQSPVTREQPTPQSPPSAEAFYAAGNAEVYPLHVLEVSEMSGAHNTASVNTMAEDPLAQTFGFQRF